jgi:hypothetical protein
MAGRAANRRDRVPERAPVRTTAGPGERLEFELELSALALFVRRYEREVRAPLPPALVAPSRSDR